MKLRFDCYYLDTCTGRIEIDDLTLIKKECYLPDGVKYPFMYFPFYNMDSAYAIIDFISKDRVYPEGRAGIDKILSDMGLSEYNWYEIIKRTHGITYDVVWYRGLFFAVEYCRGR